MVWSWSHGAEAVEPTRLIFELCSRGSGTRLTLRHGGNEGDEVAKMFRDRWPIKLRALRTILRGEHEDENAQTNRDVRAAGRYCEQQRIACAAPGVPIDQ